MLTYLVANYSNSCHCLFLVFTVDTVLQFVIVFKITLMFLNFNSGVFYDYECADKLIMK